MRHRRTLAVGAGLVALTAGGLHAEDWPQWMGPDRGGVWRETGIVERFPEGGLEVTWKVPIGNGFAGPAVADGRVFVTDWEEDPESRTVDGIERVLALDEETGEILWTHSWDTTYRALLLSYAAGPMATPTVDGERVYVLGATGLLWCLDVETGEVLWHRDYLAEFDASMPETGTSSAPLVDGEQLIAVVGGEPDALVVSFDKRTGRELWRALEVSGGSRAAPIIYEAGGVRQLIIWHPSALASLDPSTGETYWEQPWDVGGMNVVTPVKAAASFRTRPTDCTPSSRPRRSSATSYTESAATASCGVSMRARASGCG